jgi:hypothetical protein
MPRSRTHSIKGEYGTWQVRAVKREKAEKSLWKFFAKQDRKNKSEEDLSGLVEIPSIFFSTIF